MGPADRFYTCDNHHVHYHYCGGYHGCLIKGVCECYEVFCEKGDGYQPSVCGNGCGGYVKCEGGFAVLHRHCPRPRPYFCCHSRVCVQFDNWAQLKTTLRPTTTSFL
ncbi:hypothetical protein NP493_101g00011 [Ridgeia piscesae]|uniref:Uncharacterized protein n=1 Tax=Ridgeia piscesae TaxID=27915 RepID=A0AAD9P7V5_RIDPI|nr:hypothetical protein NP493_101g00011 [Ridgeia piscesae]